MSEKVTQAEPRTRVVTYTKTRVEVSQGPDAGRVMEVAGTRIRVGTSDENDLILSDATVSRRHCEIVPIAGGVQVRDEDSTNGVFVGGVKVADATFSEPFQLKLGQSVLSVTPLEDTVDREQSTNDRFGDLLGQCACMRELYADLARIAPTDVSVLIEGETGTGKELVAESIHRASRRAKGPYIVFDCGAVTPALAESELFGHERGAFTGAIADRPGVFEQADGGTIFLDELGELPKDLQPKLLRVLEKREVRRVGSNRTLSVNVRLIAATHRNLQAEIERGNFREDLYFRIAAAHVHVPPLRDRGDDLAILAEYFLSRAEPPGTLEQIPDHVWKMFHSYTWPGNVRELRNAVQRLLILPERPLGHLTQRPGMQRQPPTSEIPSVRPVRSLEPLRIARREAADEFERTYLKQLLEHTQNNITRAAAIAEVSRQLLHKLIRKYGF